MMGEGELARVGNAATLSVYCMYMFYSRHRTLQKKACSITSMVMGVGNATISVSMKER
jgi:hypothetical protein